MDGQIKSKRLCRSTFCERDMLSNCVKHKLDAWWLVIFFTSRNERFRQIEIKTWNNIMEKRIHDTCQQSMVCNHCKNLLEEAYTSAILLQYYCVASEISTNNYQDI